MGQEEQSEADEASILEKMKPLCIAVGDLEARRRQLAADILRLVGTPRESALEGYAVNDGLPPRMRVTLQRLLAGDSEKEIAGRLGRSPHTVHTHVKALYRHFGVCSRGELLARFVGSGS
jgi:DNA-binding NarL/FixJ family response regulator